MTPAQIVSCELTQKGLDDPADYGMTVLGWNPFAQTFIYWYLGFAVWYKPFSHNMGVWIARHREMNLRLEFERDEDITTMMAVINQAASDAGDYLLAGLPPATPDVPEEYQSPSERYGLGREV